MYYLYHVYVIVIILEAKLKIFIGWTVLFFSLLPTYKEGWEHSYRLHPKLGHFLLYSAITVLSVFRSLTLIGTAHSLFVKFGKLGSYTIQCNNKLSRLQ